VRVEDRQAGTSRQPDLGQQQGTVEAHLLPLRALHAFRDAYPAQHRHEIVQNLPVTDDREPGKRYEIVDVGHARSTGRCDRPRIDLIARAREQPVECEELSVFLPRNPLPVHLLQAQHIGSEPLEYGPQHGNARLQIDMRLGAHIETFDIEGRDTHGCP
jgi:hypothetical protein